MSGERCEVCGVARPPRPPDSDRPPRPPGPWTCLAHRGMAIEEKIAPPVPPSDSVFRIAWPYHPAYFGIRIIEDPDELEEAIGKDTPAETLESMKRLIGEGMRVLVLEAAPREMATFVRIIGQAASPTLPGGRS